jgi:hypothetical protein
MALQNLPTHCDGCNAKCNIEHALNCKKGGLLAIAHHNKVKNELGFLATLATSPNAVSAMNQLCFLVTLQMLKAIVNPIHALILNLLIIMKGIEATYYFKEFGNNRGTVLWMFISSML